jgi:CRP-like cAMP-binding protein
LQRLQLSELVAQSDLLRGSDLVRLLPPEAAKAVLDRAHLRRFELGAVVFREGDAGTSLFFVLRGEAQLSVNGVQVAVSRPGETFGEPELLRPAPRSLTAHAQRELEVAEIEREWLTSLGPAVRPLGMRLSEVAHARSAVRDELDEFLKRW